MIIIPFVVRAAIVEIKNPLKSEKIEDIIAAITELVKNVAISLGTIMIIISGIQYLTSAGNEERVTRAKKTMFYTIIGVAIAIGVDFIVDLIKEVLGA